MRRRARTLARASGAFGAVMALLVGWPLALALAVGWPLPTQVPSLDQLVEAARTGISDHTVLKILAVLGWLAWAQLLLAFALEFVAAARRRTPRPSVLVFPGVQRVAGRLVAAFLAVAPLVSAGPAFAEPRADLAVLSVPPAPEIPVGTAGPTSTTAPHPAETPPGKPPDERGGEEAPKLAYRVERHGSYWDIAERFLGDGRAWRAIRDLNVGRVMGDGRTVSAGADVVYPGWVLFLPANADSETPGTIPIEALDADAAPAPPTAVVEPGGHLWALAEQTLAEAWSRPPRAAEIDPYWRALIEANRDRLHEPDNPDLVFARQEFLLPPVPVLPESDPSALPVAPGGDGPAGSGDGQGVPHADATEPATEDEPGDGRSSVSAGGDRMAEDAPGDSGGRASDDPDRTAEDGDDGERDDGLPVVAVGALGIAAAGIAVGMGHALRRRRVRRAQQLPSGALPAEPAAELDDLRAELARAADHDHLDRLDAAMGALAADLSTTRRAVARPRVVQVSADRVEALLSEPSLPQTSMWRPEASGTVWVHDAQVALDGAPGSCAPTLVTLGCPEPSGQLHLDLEAEGLIAVVGEDKETSGLVRSIVLELAHSTLAESLAVTTVGDLEAPALGRLDRVAVCETWDEIGTDVLAWAEQSQALLGANRWPNAFLARAQVPDHDGLTPHVVVCAERPQSQSFDALCELVGSGATTLAVVVIGDEVPGTTRIEVAAGELRLPSLGLTCRAQAIDERVTAEVVELLHEAETVPDQLALLPDPPESDSTTPDPEEGRLFGGDGPYEDPSYAGLVRLLGDIEVVGGKRPLPPKQTALVAYLALHGPVTTERLEDALWTAPTTRLANTVSECRVTLGAQHVPPAKGGRYRVGPGVRTDTDLFERRVAYAATQPAHEAIATLRGALDLVRGPVFSYRSADRASYVWVDLENWMSTWELKVTETAARLAELYLKEADADGAVWAANQGLLASPLHSGLTEILMRAYEARGDRAAAEAVYQSHVKALEELQIDEVAESTVELRERMRRRSGDSPGESSAAAG